MEYVLKLQHLARSNNLKPIVLESMITVILTCYFSNCSRQSPGILNHAAICVVHISHCWSSREYSLVCPIGNPLWLVVGSIQSYHFPSFLPSNMCSRSTSGCAGKSSRLIMEHQTSDNGSTCTAIVKALKDEWNNGKKWKPLRINP